MGLYKKKTEIEKKYLAIGVVKGFIDPLNKNRLQVSLPSHNNIEILAKVLTSSANQTYGSNFYPDTGEEVLVAFPDGFIQNAVILGSLNNTSNPPVITPLNQQNLIEKRKTKGGSEFTWTHDRNQEKIELKTAKMHSITYDGQMETLEIKSQNAQNSLTIKLKDGEITIKAQQKITLTAGQESLVIQNGKGIEIKSNAGDLNVQTKSVKMQGNASIEIKANGNTKIEGGVLNLNNASGMTNISGSMIKLG